MSKESRKRFEVIPGGHYEPPEEVAPPEPIDDITEGVGEMGLIYNPIAERDKNIYMLETALLTVNGFLDYPGHDHASFIKSAMSSERFKRSNQPSLDMARQYSSLLLLKDTFNQLFDKRNVDTTTSSKIDDFTRDVCPSKVWQNQDYKYIALETIALAHSKLSEVSNNGFLNPSDAVNEIADQINHQALGHFPELFVKMAWKDWQEQVDDYNYAS